VGCGAGRALIELAKAFPASRFAGFDLDAEQVGRARENVRAAGLQDRVRIEQAPLDGGPYDLVCTFDVVHDAADPAGLLRSIRSALRAGGVYLCGEINAGPALSDNLNPLGALYYGVSVLYCLSVSLAAGGPGLGSLGLPEPALVRLCEQAGFGAVRRLPIDDPFHALYEVRP